MNKSVDFELNMAGLNELMKSAEMQAHLRQAAAAVAQSAGPGYGSDVHIADYVAIGTAFPDSEEAAIDNAENNTLLKALGSVGLSMKKG